MTMDPRLERARDDYRQHLGKVIEVTTAYAYSDDGEEPVEFDPPLLFTVAESDDGNITRECVDHIDPYWNVIPVFPDDPQVREYMCPEYSTLEVYGPSWGPDGERNNPTEWRLLEPQPSIMLLRIKRRLGAIWRAIIGKTHAPV